MAEQLTLNQLVGSSSLPRLTSTLCTKEPVRAIRTVLVAAGGLILLTIAGIVTLWVRSARQGELRRAIHHDLGIEPDSPDTEETIDG
jgi:hypothetical protein